MKKAFIVLALCLCALPALQARSLTEEELLESTALLLNMEAGAQLTAEEQMLLATSGMYGNSPSNMGSYGGVLTQDDDFLDLESGSNAPSTISTPTTTTTPTTSTGAATNAQAKAAASSAVAADKSTAMLVAGVMVAVSAFLL